MLRFDTERSAWNSLSNQRMYFKDIIGLQETKTLLHRMYEKKRIAHALFFVGSAQYGGLPLAIAYARMLLNEQKEASTDLKIDKLQHSDLHFIFPSAPNEKVKPTATSLDFLNEWREFLCRYPYGNLFHWLEYLEIQNKQVQIGVEEVSRMVKNLQTKSYEGGYKVLILWMPERLHLTAANKLLKILEEPPEKTVFLLVGEKQENLLPTLRSRLQMVRLKPLPLGEMQFFLQQKQGLSKKQAFLISQRSQGQWGKALSLLEKREENLFEDFFVHWIRNVFIARKKPVAIKTLIGCSETLHHWGRETQKEFLNYTLYVFQQALLTKYQVESICFNPFDSEGFNWEAFSKLIEGENMQNIFNEIERAIKDIERNAYAKMVFLDLSIHLTNHLHHETRLPLR